MWLLRKITAVFFLLSLLLWTLVTFLLMCEPMANEYPQVSLRDYKIMKGVAPSGNKSVEDAVGWFTKKLPSHSEDTLQSWCPPVNSSNLETDFLVTLVAVGDLHLALEDENTLEPQAATFLANISGVLRGADAVVTNLASSVPNEETSSVEILRSLRAIGIRVMSLANTYTRSNGMVSTIHVLEAADIRWLGLNCKQHEIVMAGRKKFGFLAFCGVHRECIESPSFPFAPLKYNPKVATGAVSELKEVVLSSSMKLPIVKKHGVDVIIVLMYWGRTNSYYPDETMLTIARHLAQLGVTVVIGYHPSVVQDHAYFGRTLVIFSLGKLLSSDKVTPYCWRQKVPHQWEYATFVDQCKMVHPDLRKSLLRTEQLTRIYRIRFPRAGDVAAEYVTLPLQMSPSGTRRPRVVVKSTNWTTVCGELDHHCLSCKPL